MIKYIPILYVIFRARLVCNVETVSTVYVTVTITASAYNRKYPLRLMTVTSQRLPSFIYQLSLLQCEHSLSVFSFRELCPSHF